MEPKFEKITVKDYIQDDEGNDVLCQLIIEQYTDENSERIVSCEATLLGGADISDSSFHDEIVKWMNETKKTDRVYFECEIEMNRHEYDGPMTIEY